MKRGNKEALLTNTDKKKFISCSVVGVILVLIAVVIMLFPSINSNKDTVFNGFSDVDKICELATLKCYYHNVAEYKKEPDGLFKYGLFKYGYKKFWMEYDGIVKVGIDVGEVVVNDPDENGVVCIYVPEAKVLEVNADERSMSDLIIETGKLTKITTEEKVEAFALAQKNMKENAESDKSILNKAHNNAKELLKQYVINVGEQIGQEYTVEWIDKP